MGTIVARDNSTGRALTFRAENFNVLDQGLRSNRFTPLRDDGEPAQVNLFEGGVLVEGAPLNVWLLDVWYDGQKAILDPFYRSGEILVPPEYLLALPEVETPPDVLAEYAASKGVPDARSLTEAYQTGSSGSILSNPWVLGAIGVGFLMLISGGGRKTIPSGPSGDLNL